MGVSKYPSEFRQRAVRMARESERPIAAIARDLGMHHETLRVWVRQRHTGRTRLDLELALVSYIGWYNARRRHRSLKRPRNGKTRRQSPLQALASYTEQTVAQAVVSNR